MGSKVQLVTVNHSGKPTFEAFGELKTLSEWRNDARCVVDKATLEKRLFGGWTLEESLSVRPGEAGSHDQSSLVTAFGEEKTLEAWGRDERSRAPIVVIRQRLQDGCSPEEAIGKPGLAIVEDKPKLQVVRSTSVSRREHSKRPLKKAA